MATDNYNFTPLTPRQGRLLVRLARFAIAKKLGQPASDPMVTLSHEPEDDILNSNFGTFVTLTKAGRLRGCIGSLEAKEPLQESIRHNAINAAFHDPRFKPLTAEELEAVNIEVSVLTPPQPLSYRDGDDLLETLTPGEDGLIIGKGMMQATFLPQVWQQLPDPQQFLTQLCLKAGLAADSWQQDKLKVETYRVQYFEETS
jgi:AmmeMemoRadiSam system protein A